LAEREEKNKKKKEKEENEKGNKLAIFVLPVVVTTTYMVDSRRKTHVLVVDD